MLLLSASLVDFRPMHSSEALHAHSDRQVLGNALGFADFQRVTFHLNEKSANQGLHMDKSQLVVQVMFRSFLKTGLSETSPNLPKTRTFWAPFRIAGYSAKWITSGLPVTQE
jgi:hypothetical protein